MYLCLIILGNGALTQSHTIKMNMMLERLQKSPFEIGKKIDNRKQSEVEAIFTRAFAMNMIRLDTALGYITENGAALGMNKQAAMTKLSTLPEVMRVMDYESRNKLRNNVKFVGVENKPPTQEEILQQHILNSRNQDASFIPAMNEGIDTFVAEMPNDPMNSPIQDVADDPEWGKKEVSDAFDSAKVTEIIQQTAEPKKRK